MRRDRERRGDPDDFDNPDTPGQDADDDIRTPSGEMQLRAHWLLDEVIRMAAEQSRVRMGF